MEGGRLLRVIAQSKDKIALVIIIALNLFFSISGNQWGLPDRWNVDESVATALRMAQDKTIIPPENDTHPTFYYFVLMAAIFPYYLYLKLSGFPLIEAQVVVGSSWIRLAEAYPGLATNLYLIARSTSAIFGALTVWLIYVVTSRLYNRKTGICAAAILSLTMSFVTENHFAKSSALVNLLIVSVLCLCVFALEKKSLKYFYFASFLTGLSCATKYNGILVIAPLLLTYYLIHKPKQPLDAPGKSFFYLLRYYFFRKSAFVSWVLLVVGICIGFPAAILKFIYPVKSLSYYAAYIPGSVQNQNVALQIILSLKNNFLRLVTSFGLPFWLFVFGGYIMALKKLKNKFNPGVFIIVFFVIFYFLFVSIFQKYPRMAPVKYLIAIIPFLSIFGGKAIYEFINAGILSRGSKILILGVVFYVSLIYVLSANRIFLKEDTRYYSTSWIQQNIPYGAKISIFDEVDRVFSSRLLSKYNVSFFGNTTSSAANRNIFRNLNNNALQDDYFRLLNEKGCVSDYIIISFCGFAFLADYLRDTDFGPEGDRFMHSLIRGKIGYNLVKKFESTGNLLWDPKNEYMSPTILIFKR